MNLLDKMQYEIDHTNARGDMIADCNEAHAMGVDPQKAIEAISSQTEKTTRMKMAVLAGIKLWNHNIDQIGTGDKAEEFFRARVHEDEILPCMHAMLKIVG